MTTVLPIKGLRFSAAAGSLSAVITPPYDVIDTELQEKFYTKSPYNIIRLEYAQSRPEDNHQVNKYTRAAKTFQQWLQEGILIQEEKPAFYLYEQHFTYKQKKYMRQGIYCGVGLSPFEEGKVVPHEETLHQPKLDRLQLLRHCEAHFSPILGLYKDQGKFVDYHAARYKKEQKPVINFQDEDGQLHKLWAITDENFIATVKTFFQEKKIYIADGHHRYETALQYYLGKKEENQSKEKYGHTLMALINIYDEGLLAFPTHRMIKQSSISSQDLLKKLQKHFYIQPFSVAENREELLTMLEKSLTGATEEKLCIGLYTPEKKFFLLTIKDLIEKEKPFPWLDTVILQELVLQDIFGWDEADRKKGSYISYIRDEWEAKQQVDKGKVFYVFFLNKSSLEDIINLAEQGIRMPQKSTYFFPKLVSGLVILQLGMA